MFSGQPELATGFPSSSIQVSHVSPLRRPTAYYFLEVRAGYSKHGCHKVDQLATIAAALKRMDLGHIKPRSSQAMKKTQRYRFADRFTADELAQLVARYQAGEMSTALARESGIAKSSFLRLLAEHGVTSRPRGLTPAKENEIRRLRKQGMIIREIAKQVGCSYDTARIFLLHGTGR